MPWYKITLTNTDISNGVLERAEIAFRKKMFEFVGAKDMAVFDCEDGDNTVLYVSPKMALVSPSELSEFSAQETMSPHGNETEFSVLVSSDTDAALALIHS